jgi:hypothetical protein
LEALTLPVTADLAFPMAAAAVSSAPPAATSLLPCVSTMQIGQSRRATAIAEAGVSVQFDADFKTSMDYVMSCRYYQTCGPSLQPGVVAATSAGEVLLTAITPSGLAPVAVVSKIARIQSGRSDIWNGLPFRFPHRA